MKKQSLPSSPVVYPVGSYVKTEKGYFYIADSSRRFRIVSERVLNSWSPQRLIVTSEAAVSKYRISAKLKFRNGSLIWNLSDGRLYLIENGKRRWIVSPDAFERIGIQFDRNQMPKGVLVVSKDEINLHEVGEELN